ncbi:heparanase-like [Pomacea canaliculata]|uniref:heparanase-like n=1 Tax=Pomacea canaliculata TaxID=400727 RepID=UPI000D7393E0|nr:heparanase-like [Pomacea canaliculata]
MAKMTASTYMCRVAIALLILMPGSYQAEIVHFVPASSLNLTVPADVKVREPVSVHVSLQQSINTIGPHFVSVTLDSSLVHANWSTFDFRSTKLQNLAHGLSPSYLRLGGTTADALIFQSDSSHPSHGGEGKPVEFKSHPIFNMTTKQFDDINHFARTVGWDFIMDLNALIRFPNGSWDPSNAQELLRYGSAKNYSIVGFQLGNEYDLYHSAFNYTVLPSQLAKDVLTLSQVLAKFPLYSSSFIVGPETASNNNNFFHGFLASGGATVVRAGSLHHYYMKGSTAVLKNYTDVGVLNRLVGYLQSALSQTRSVVPDLPVWLSETSSSYGGGTPNITDRFVAGFVWLDKLGVSSTMGLNAVFRQTFYGGNYPLLDTHLNPNPDYWLTLLFKRLIRGPVFNVTGASDVRMYAACANPDSFSLGALVIYFLNPNNYYAPFNLSQFPGQELRLYILTAGDSAGLMSKFSALNGAKLLMNGNELPHLSPATQTHGPVIMPPYSFGFVVLPNAAVTLCRDI